MRPPRLDRWDPPTLREVKRWPPRKLIGAAVKGPDRAVRAWSRPAGRRHEGSLTTPGRHLRSASNVTAGRARPGLRPLTRCAAANAGRAAAVHPPPPPSYA